MNLLFANGWHLFVSCEVTLANSGFVLFSPNFLEVMFTEMWMANLITSGVDFTC